MSEDEVRAFDALAAHPRLSDLALLTREVARRAADKRLPETPATVTARAEELKLSKDDAATDFGNALSVLELGPQDGPERALACALYAHALAEARPKGSEEEDRAASDLLWLANHTPFDATRLLDRAMGDGASEWWNAMADRIRRIDKGQLPTLGRGEGLLACAALAQSASESARRARESLGPELRDSMMVSILAGRREAAPTTRLVGEMASPPRGPVATTLLAITGLLLVAGVARVLARFALAYRRPAEATFSKDGVRVHARAELLGRTLRDREFVLPRAGLMQAVREVRYPRLGLYVGLLALAAGSYVGVSIFADGVHAASPSLLLVGLVIVALGVGIDFLLSVVAPGSTGRCRVILIPKSGAAVCVVGVDATQADAAMATLT